MAILVVILVVVLMVWQGRERTHRLRCGENLRAIGTALMLYHERYPEAGAFGLAKLVEDGLVPAQALVCPSVGSGAANYIVVWDNLKREPLPNDAVIVYEPKSNHRGAGGCALFADGHVSFMRVPAYDKLVATLPPATAGTENNNP